MSRTLCLLALVAACGTPQEGVVCPAASATPTAPATSEFPIKTMFVDAQVVDCEGEGPRKCMRVRASADAEWELFYDRIEGFELEAGHAYELRVEVRPVGGPPADASSLAYKLVEVVSKTAQ